MKHITRMSICKTIRKGAVIDFVKEQINNRKFTDKEIKMYCKNCQIIGMTFSGISRYGMRSHNVVVSCIFSRLNNELVPSSVLRCQDWRHDKKFGNSYVSDIDFSQLNTPTTSYVLKALHSWEGKTDGWNDPQYIYTLEGKNTNYRITYDIFTMYNILTKLYCRYYDEYPTLKQVINEMIEEKIKADISNSKHYYEKFTICQVSREILEHTKNVMPMIDTIFDWIDKINII